MPKMILVADDEPHVARFIQVHLERAGYSVATASSGQETKNALQAQLPDLLVCDEVMPDFGALEIVKWLRSSPETTQLPVIVLKSKYGSADMFLPWRGNYDCYLTKPFNPLELITFVQKIFAANT